MMLLKFSIVIISLISFSLVLVAFLVNQFFFGIGYHCSGISTYTACVFEAPGKAGKAF